MERGISGGIRSPMIFRRAIDDDRFSFFFFFLIHLFDDRCCVVRSVLRRRRNSSFSVFSLFLSSLQVMIKMGDLRDGISAIEAHEFEKRCIERKNFRRGGK